jgi:hypothetical protein
VPTTRTEVLAPPSGAPVLSYDVPQQVCHTGQNIIELRLPRDYFLASAAGNSRTEVGS